MGFVELRIECSGETLRIQATSPDRVASPVVDLPEPYRVAWFQRFRDDLADALARGAGDLDGALRARAQEAYRALLSTFAVQEVFTPLKHAAGPNAPLLIRVVVLDDRLESVPWEALCEPGTEEGFLGLSPWARVVRATTVAPDSTERPAKAPLRLLVVAPAARPESVSALEAAVKAVRSPSGAAVFEWMAPLVGPRAHREALFERLDAERRARDVCPDIVHLWAHGRVHEKVPQLCFSGDDGAPDWIGVERLAGRLAPWFARGLSLVHLAACESAGGAAADSHTSYANAAEVLIRAGAAAVVAHLFRVPEGAALLAAETFYRGLADDPRGDLCASLQKARETVLWNDWPLVASLSPVVYTRSGGPFLFAAQAVSSASTSPAAPAPALSQIFSAPFSLVLGDRGRTAKQNRDALAAELRAQLGDRIREPVDGLPLSALCQRYATFFREDLDECFRRTVGAAHAAPSAEIAALAGKLGPGVHVSLLWKPTLEQAISETHEGAEILAIHPPAPGRERAPRVLRCRRSATGGFETTREQPGRELPRMDRTFIVLRPYGGYSFDARFAHALLTEDDYVQGLIHLGDALPALWAEPLRVEVASKPLLFVETAARSWRHRMLLRRLFEEQTLTGGSVAVVADEELDGEGAMWRESAGVFGDTLDVVTTGQLAAALGIGASS